MRITPNFCTIAYARTNKKTCARNYKNADSTSVPISASSVSSLSFGEIFFMDINPEYNNQIKEIKKATQAFSEDKNNSQFLGQGCFASAYAIMPNIVLKKPLSRGEDFIKEGKNLKMIPEEITSTQKFVAALYDSEQNCDYLLSTKVDGVSASPLKNPWKAKHLKSLFDTFFQLDKEGIIHGDLNNGNIKLTSGGKVNLLDFQYAYKIPENEHFKEKEEIHLPGFIYPQNSQMFETAALAHYLKRTSNKTQAKEFLRLYLSEKSKYHQKRYDFLEEKEKAARYGDYNTFNQAKAFEKAQEIVFQNPSDNVIKIEAKKIQFLSSFRQAYRHLDQNIKHKNIISAPSAYLLTMSNVQDFNRELDKQRRKLFLSAPMKDYLNNQRQYGEFWMTKLKKWTPETFNYVLGESESHFDSSKAKGSYDSIEEKNASMNNFGVISDIVGKIDENYRPKFTQNFSLKNKENDTSLKVINSTIKELSAQTETSDIKDITKQLEALKKVLNETYEEQRGLDVLNFSVLGAIKANELRSVAYNYQSEDIKKAAEISKKMKQEFINLANNSFNIMYKEICDNNENSRKSSGYKDMGNFKQTDK